jgi:hypothetical protein
MPEYGFISSNINGILLTSAKVASPGNKMLMLTKSSTN